MTARRFGLIVSSFVGASSFCLASYTGPVGLYHDAEGGAIGQPRQAPPGLDQPYPNLADVPRAYSPAAADAQAGITAQARATGPDVSPANPAALAGLELPVAPPPLPVGLTLPAAPAPQPPAPPPPPPPPRLSPPVALAFAPHRALLPEADDHALADIAAHRGDARILAGGFGDDGSLTLAIARAQRVAAALTALGVPARDIRIVASAAGSGGFVQLVY